MAIIIISTLLFFLFGLSRFVTSWWWLILLMFVAIVGMDFLNYIMSGTGIDIIIVGFGIAVYMYLIKPKLFHYQIRSHFSQFKSLYDNVKSRFIKIDSKGD
ncbi:hypothetical protein [Lentilactobacillus hilgardii]|uniref:Uncharacterized protein n=1 Tax=Lentilactobacillus hilgardii TaxID=1588 RepID=A0A6P1E4F3_LENHI|nr:hypothetical protein [Lentilactobacillus hilgardii]EEI71656.1 hypothetical protein HMPREF0496_1075 [Lentilactobacillus hilgardii ATCC 27305]MCT3392876.1 hypothetical protein [Lentilactobacillus hilgardii]QHB51439.1 hypothetical protein GQR93_04005 [Lentilactobacillus hilgardii]RRG08904.1 MAG: hypothetical protein DUD35_10855 [Lactobacillus sp.]